MSIVINGQTNDITVGGVGVTLDTELNLKADKDSPALTGAPTVNGVAFSGYSGFKNYIINGNFDIWQRGTSFTTGDYNSDRWFTNQVGGDVAVTRTYVGTMDIWKGSPYVWQGTPQTGVTSWNVLQRIEGVETLSGKTVTVSFTAAVSTGTMSLSDTVLGLRIKQYFGTGGSSFVNTPFPNNIIITTTPTRYTATVTLPNINGKTVGTSSFSELIFQSNTVTVGQTLYLSQVQLEEGSVATPFENRPYGLELSLCQRYYEKLTNVNTPFVMYTPNGDTRVSIPFKVKKRLIPECTISGTINSIAVGKDGVAVNIVLTISTVIEKTVDGIYSITVTNPSALQYCGTVVSGQGHYELTAIASAEL